jgi:hypothetical protein
MILEFGGIRVIVSTLLYVSLSLSVFSLLPPDSCRKNNKELGTFLSTDAIFFINKAEDRLTS